MASEEVKKKWGTIFMGNREASVEQLNAMQEPLHREQRQREQADDYMERVRARAADRAREILGAAYAERQKVLEEARIEAGGQKKKILADCDSMRAEAESARQAAKAELARAEAERKEAEELRKAAHDEGYQAGLSQASSELHEFRLELGQALGSLMRALEWQQNEILGSWRNDLVSLVQCAAQAGAGYVLSREHEAILRALVFQALDLLESRRAISLRVNPADEAQVADLFRAARERYPELGQWIVTGDEKIEKGGLVAESGSGSVDLKRENFRELVDGVLTHLALPKGDNEAGYEEMIREIVEREASRIASLTPEMELPSPELVETMEEAVPDEFNEENFAEEDFLPEEAPDGEGEVSDLNIEEQLEAEAGGESSDNAGYAVQEPEEEWAEDVESDNSASLPDVPAADPSLAALEEELFPLDESEAVENAASPSVKPLAEDSKSQTSQNDPELNFEPETLARGGFL